MANCDPMTEISQNIRRLMAEKGMRQEDLSHKTNIARANISRLLTSKQANPTIRTLDDIAKALGVTVCDLLSESREKLAC